MVEAILGRRFEVQSAHQQAAATLPEDIEASARSDDGLIEAIAHIRRPFAVGVLWHPEVESGIALFEALHSLGTVYSVRPPALSTGPEGA